MFGRQKTTSPQQSPPPPVETERVVIDDMPEEFEPLWRPEAMRARKSVEQLLLERGQVTEEQLLQARNVQQQTPGKSIAQILLSMSAASEAQILSALAETQALAFETPEKASIDAKAFALLQPDYIRRHFVLPLRFDGIVLVVA